MTDPTPLLETLWRGALVHLWQTALVLAVLAVLVRVLRDAPGRVLHGLYGLALLKLLVPVAWLEPLIEPWRDAWLAGPGTRGAPGPVLIEYASAALRPAVWSPETPAHVVSSPVAATLTAVWALGLAGLIGATCLRSRKALGDLRKAAHIDASQEDRLGQALRGSGIARDRVTVVHGPHVPFVAGLLRPRILVPDRVVRGLPAEELQAILMHEKAHLDRRDPLRALVWQLAAAVWFFFPPVWWLARRLRQTAEIACDERVLRGGVTARTYTRAMARTLALGLAPVRIPGAVGLGLSSNLKSRLDRIEHSWRYRVMPKHRLAVAAAIAVVLISCLPLLTVSAGEPEGLGVVPQLKPSKLPQSMPELEVLEGKAIPVTFSADRVPLERFFDAVEQQAGMVILEDGAMPVVSSLKIDGVPASEALRRVAGQQGLALRVLDAYTVAVSSPLLSGVGDVTNPTLITATKVAPEYPEEARRKGIEGRVILQAVIFRDGTVGNLQVLRGEEPDFVQAAMEAVGQWQYVPGTKDGIPVDVFFTIYIEFQLGENHPRPEREAKLF